MTVPSPETNKSVLEKFKHVLDDLGEHELRFASPVLQRAHGEDYAPKH